MRILQSLPLRLRKLVVQTVAMADDLNMTVYLVGGPVRDLLLHRPCRDLDLAVEGDAVVLAQRLASASGAWVVAHTRFGTSKVIWPDKVRVDLAGTRTDTYAQPGALPQVTSADIRADLGRRDFSINALALALNGRGRGEVLDFFQGQEDLLKKRVRILHARSFQDDPTRLFRAVRFEQRLGFRLEASTLREFKQAVAGGGLGTISPSRIFQELRLVLREAEYVACLKRLAGLGVLSQVQPGLKPVPARLALNLNKTVVASRTWGIEGLDEELLKFLALTEPLTPMVWKACLSRFPWPRTWVEKLQYQKTQADNLSKALSGRSPMSPVQMVGYLDPCPAENLIFLPARYPGTLLARRVQGYLRQWSKVQPVLTGEDLKALGYAPGQGFGKMLRALRQGRLEGKLHTRAQEKKYLREKFPRMKQDQ